MSTNSRVGVVRSLYDLFALGDLDAVIELLHPELVIDEQIGNVAYSGVYRGHDGFRVLTKKLMETVEMPMMSLGESIVGAGDVVVGVNHMTFRSRRSGRSTTLLTLELFRFRDGKIVEIAPRYDGSAITALDSD
jgi:ketosteroid isomerase-like protein